MPSFSRRDPHLDKLQPLASRKGYAVTKAMTKGLYYLLDMETEQRAMAPNDTPAFTPLEALRFLTGLKDRGSV